MQIPAGILSASEYTILRDFCCILVFSGNTSSSSLQYTDLKPIQVSNLMQLENPIQLENNQRSSNQTSSSGTTIREPGITFLQSTFTWPYLKCSKILIILHFEFELQRLSSWTIPASVVRMRSSTKQLPTFCTQLVSSETENNSSWSVFLKTVRSPFQTSVRLPGRLQVCSGFPTQCQLKHAFYFGVLCFRFGTAVDYNSSSGVDFEQRTAAASRATSATEN